VTLALPQEEVDDDRHLTRGARVRDLAQGLAALHQKDFGDLLKGDEVRYQVVGAEELGPGEIEVRFGHAVYLPAPGEKVQYTVSVSRDSAVWKTVCPVYPNQRLTVIGQDEQSATHAVPGWPFGLDAAILLINDGLESPLEVQVRPKEAFECVYDQAGGYYAIRSRRGAVDAAGAPLRLLLRITSAPGSRALPARPVQARAASVPASAPTSAHIPAHIPAPTLAARTPSAPAPSARPAVWKPRQAAEADMTAVPLARPAQPAAQSGAEADATYAPVARQRVALAALALPRLSRYRETGAQAFEIGLNRALMPSAPGADTLLGFAVDDGDTLHAVSAAGRAPVTAPASFSPVDGAKVELLAIAPEMAERYVALLRLPQAQAAPVAPGARFLFGRGAPMLAGLRVLDSPRFLRAAAGAGAGAGSGAAASSADRLGLSRNAFSFEAAADGYRIARASPTQALYHLDEQLHFVAAIGEATPEQPYRLPAGHHLVAGHYVLRFDA
jgi:hypothetical protein